MPGLYLPDDLFAEAQFPSQKDKTVTKDKMWSPLGTKHEIT